MNKSSKIYLAGHSGLVGSAINRLLVKNGYENILVASHGELDLTQQLDVSGFFSKHQPEYVILAAAKVGGIYANDTYPADFIRDNLLMQTNVIDAAYKNGAKKLLFLGSSCIYPKYADQPIKEEYLLTGQLEQTNEWYAIAKIAGIKQCQAYRKQYNFNAISLMPTNLYGIGDNFDLNNSHVVPALIRKFHEAKIKNQRSVKVWGSGTPRREFLFVDDLADAALFLMSNYDEAEIVNVGVGSDVTIRDLALLISEVLEYTGKIEFDKTRPDGTPQKLLDVTRVNDLGWSANMSLRDGLMRTYEWYKNHAL